jgi:hypothetical protein
MQHCFRHLLSRLLLVKMELLRFCRAEFHLVGSADGQQRVLLIELLQVWRSLAHQVLHVTRGHEEAANSSDGGVWRDLAGGHTSG